MKIKAVNNSEVFESHGDSKKHKVLYSVDVGDIYDVVGISIGITSGFGPMAAFFTYYHRKDRTIYSAPAIIFEVVENSIPTEWSLLRSSDPNALWIGPNELEKNPHLIEDLSDSEPDALVSLRKILHLLRIIP